MTHKDAAIEHIDNASLDDKKVLLGYLKKAIKQEDPDYNVQRDV